MPAGRQWLTWGVFAVLGGSGVAALGELAPIAAAAAAGQGGPVVPPLDADDAAQARVAANADRLVDKASRLSQMTDSLQGGIHQALNGPSGDPAPWMLAGVSLCSFVMCLVFGCRYIFERRNRGGPMCNPMGPMGNMYQQQQMYPGMQGYPGMQTQVPYRKDMEELDHNNLACASCTSFCTGTTPSYRDNSRRMEVRNFEEPRYAPLNNMPQPGAHLQPTQSSSCCESLRRLTSGSLALVVISSICCALAGTLLVLSLPGSPLQNTALGDAVENNHHLNHAAHAVKDAATAVHAKASPHVSHWAGVAGEHASKAAAAAKEAAAHHGSHFASIAGQHAAHAAAAAQAAAAEHASHAAAAAQEAASHAGTKAVDAAKHAHQRLNDHAQAAVECSTGWQHWQTEWADEKKAMCCTQFGRGCPGTEKQQIVDDDGKGAASQQALLGRHRLAPACSAHTNNVLAWYGQPRLVDDTARAGEVVCCNKMGKSMRTLGGHCISGKVNQLRASKPLKTYTEAYNLCTWAGLTLCNSTAQLDESCGSTCGYDRTLVWLDSATDKAGEEATDFDCALGKSNWEDGFSDTKKLWCCLHEGAPCDEKAIAMLAFTCKTSHSSDWTEAEKAYCCKHDAKGTEVCNALAAEVEAAKELVEQPGQAATSEPGSSFECNEGVEGWERGWSTSKKQYCCRTSPPRGCDKEGSSATADAASSSSSSSTAPPQTLQPAVVPSPATTTPVPRREPDATCQPGCSFTGRWGSCAYHIQSIVTYKQKVGALNCTAAWATMIISCPECLECNVNGAACVEAKVKPPPQTFSVRKN